MKKLLGLFFLGLFLFAGCATVKPPEPGILGEYSQKMDKGTGSQAAYRWVKPGVDFAKYNKVMIDPVTFAPPEGEESSMKDIEPEKLKELADKCNAAVAKAVSAKYPVVTEPGPDVMRVRFAIIDMKKNYPVFAGVTSILPIGLALAIVKRPVTGRWTGGGSANAQVMVKDSTTDEVIGAAQTNYEAGFFERFSTYGTVEDAFQYFGERLVKFMDDSRIAKKQ